MCMGQKLLTRFLLAMFILVIGAPNSIFAHSVDRCEGAKALLNDPKGSGLTNEEIGYFKTIVESNECRRQETKSTRTTTKAPMRVKPIKAAVILPQGPFSATQCDTSVSKLAQLQAVRQSETSEGQRQYAIWSSSDCLNRRKRGALNVSPGMADMAVRLKANNIDLDNRIDIELRKCALLTDQSKKSSCTLNSRLVAYSAAINEMNTKRKNRHETKMRNYQSQLAATERKKQERLDRIAADKAAHNESMRKWRERVALCKQGKREYCAG